MGSANIDTTKTNQWQRLSWRNVRSSWTDNQTAQFRFDFEGMAENTIAYVDDAMLIDLTAAFGAGNEPTQEWCDTNIGYFAGDTIIQYEAPDTYDLTITAPTRFKAGDILNCPYSGSAKSIALPKGQYKLECWGAQGGYRSSANYGGKGGYSAGTIVLTEKTLIYLYSGGAGNTGKTNGGFNGGGKRSGYNGGGGASDIRIGTDSLYARIIVAGGGGSDGATFKTGMYGGGVTGGSSSESYGTGGYGGTQTGVSSSSWQTTSQSTSTTTQAGAYSGFGFGGNGIYYSSGYGGAGGGGWYGGSGTYPDGSGDDDKGGGGGSGYVYTSSTASNYPSGCLLNSQYYLENATTLAGNTAFTSPTGTSETGHTGDGYIRITVIEVNSGNIFFKDSDGTWLEQKQIFVNTGASSIIPSELVELEYIENTNTSYINTGFNPDSLTKTVITFQMTANNGTHQVIFGSRASSSSMQYVLGFAGHQSPTVWRSDYGTNQTEFTSSLRYDTKYTCTKDGKTCTLGNETNTHTAVTFSSSYPIYLFACNTSNAVGNNAKAKIYSCKIYDNGTLVRDLIPAKRLKDNICGLWDKVNYKFYTDENGNNFTAGSEKSAIASPGTAIEYIESSGTQYINTNILGQDISKVNVDFQFTSVPSGAEAQIAAIYVSSTVYFQIGWSGSSFMRTSEYTYSQTANSLARTQAEGTPTGRPNYTLWLFGQNETGTLKHPASAKIYSCKIYDNNNTLVRDFIPIKTTTNIYGLWDKVNKVFYSNVGTGTFTGGSTVTLSGWHLAKTMWVKTTSDAWTQVL